MLIDQVREKNNIGVSIQNSGAVSITRILIPVSFSELSYNALAYALKLVKALNGVIELFHVIDIDEIVESDNPLVVKRWLIEREKLATSRIRSLAELIGENNVDVTYSVSTGHKRSCLLKKVKEVSPDMVVLGRRSDGDDLAAFIAENTSCTLLVVPPSSIQSPPLKIALATDREVRYNHPSIFFKVVQQCSGTFTLLDPRGGGMPSGERIAANGSHIYINHAAAENVESYVRRNGVDMLCLARRRQTLLQRVFRKRSMFKPFIDLRIPILLVDEFK